MSLTTEPTNPDTTLTNIFDKVLGVTKGEFRFVLLDGVYEIDFDKVAQCEKTCTVIREEAFRLVIDFSFFSSRATFLYKPLGTDIFYGEVTP